MNKIDNLSLESFSNIESFWRDFLRGTVPLKLPAIAHSPSSYPSRGTQELRLSNEQTSRLTAFAKNYELTLYTVIQGAWSLFLSHYSGETDVLFGATRVCRQSSKLNVLPIRVSIAPDASVLSWLKKLQIEWEALDDYASVPLAQIRQWSEVPLEVPLLETLVIFEAEQHQAALQRKERNGKSRKLNGLEQGEYSLILSVDAKSDLLLTIDYERSQFGDDAIARMLGHLETLLLGIAANPEQCLAQIPLLTEKEKHQLLVEWNQTATDYPKNKCIHQLFEEQVERTPDAVALVFEEQQLTYRELNCRANQLAHYLQKLGVKPEVFVGICAERSLEMVIGLLGILKAGGAYVPLDPAYPRDRLAFMLDDAQVSVLLTQQSLIEKLPNLEVTLVCLETDGKAIELESQENLATNAQPDNLAYVMYTSGSTGKPKGVCAIHQGIVRLVKETNYANFSSEEVFLQLAPISFDASTLEIWGSLLNGAKLIIFPLQTPSLQELGKAIREYQITTLWLTAGLFHQMVDEQLEDLKSLRQLLAGGDILSVPHVQRVLRELEGCQLINGYGPTENTTFTCCYASAQTTQLGHSVPIGRPIANTQVYILNQHRQPVPIGVSGELFIGGDGLARGYLNRPELNAEKFIPHPFSNEPTARLYKTGDLARHRSDGNIEFLGRIDNQVKIRGFRIELAEIEAVLRQHPAIQEVAVMVQEEQPGDKRLVAYIVSSLPSTNPNQWRQFLSQNLPSYMVPSAFIQLDALPLTVNGKVDRRALPVPDYSRIPDTSFVPPRTATEEILAHLWSEVLKVEPIGIHDNFFELGGHSLLATQVISRIRQALGLELPLRFLFESPTIAQFAQQIATPEQTEALLVPPITPRKQRENLPLSFAQQRLWFLNQLEPNSTAYNLSYTFRLQGVLNISALEQSFREIIQRHEILRTNFISVDGQTIQAIATSISFSLPVIDLERLPGSQQEVEAQKIANQEAQQPFNLAIDSLLRVKLLRLNAQEHLLLLNIHHIIFDGWSVGVLFAQLSAVYAACLTDKPSLLPELPIQYADFTLWQRQWLAGAILDTQLHYWKQQLGGTLPVLELPTDYPRPPVQTYQGAAQSVRLSAQLTAALKSLSQQEGVTLFMTLLAAFKILLARYSGQEDVIVGTPIAGRNRREIEGLIGFFVNTLALRTDLGDNPSFRQLLSRVRQVCLGAYAHQDLPFEQIVEVLQPERNLSHTPVFQVMFALQNTPIGEFRLPDLTLTPVEQPIETAKFDLTLAMEERDGLLIGEWEYNTDLFDASTIGRMIQHFQTLLAGIVTAPEQNIWQLPLLTETEREQLLVAWNPTQVIDYPKDKYIHQLFEEQVERTPDAVAVVFEDRQLTYRELNQRVNQLAHHLQKLGVKPEQLVALCLEQSLERIIGLLGILKAGGVYLPLDPLYPQERLKFMVEDSQVSILLTRQSLASRFATNSLQIVNLDADWQKIQTESANNPQSSITGQNLAYIIYTSGSTGIPKGVLIEHHAIAQHCQNIIEHYQLSSSDRILQFASLSFDVSLEQILPTLAVGATLILANAKLLTGSDFNQKLIDYGLTVVDLPPAYWTQWLQSLDEKAFATSIPPLRLVICGGEALPPESLKIWQNSPLKAVRLINAYGPTETTITATTFEVPQGVVLTDSFSNIPIGRPLKNRKAYILDSHKNLVPIGVTGELHIGGDGLARGYLNHPELTDEKFIVSPLENSKLYKTGDLARYLPDGNIEFLGRIDNQVKIRGFRIELGEIESLLNQHPAVLETKVIAREDIPGEPRLVAYLVLHPSPNSQSEIPNQLRQILKQKLPHYMVPSAFVVLETFPLTPNGKIDHRALPAPDFSHVQRQGTHIAPRTPTEEILANLWAEVLQVEPIGIHDNFFELGGHSLLATQVISRIRQAFGLELPLRFLFESPTIAQIAQHISTATETNRSLPIPSIEPRKQQEILPLSFAQQRLWFLDQLEPNSTAYNMPFTLRLQGVLNVSALEQSLREIIQRHEILRTNFISVDGQPIQAIATSISFSLPVIDLEGLPGSQRELEAQKIANQEAKQPFNLAIDSLLRVKLLRLHQTEHLLILNIHHIIFDGWSFEVLFEELKAIYAAFCDGQPSLLPPLPIQYADFTLWQRQWLTGVILDTQLHYWKQQLGGTLPVLELPTDSPRPPVQTYQGAAQSVRLSAQLTAALKSLSQQEGVTLFMTLLAAFKILLARYSGQEDVIVGTPIAGRNRREIEGLIGFFVNTLALRTDLGDNPSFRQLLSRVRQVTLEAYAHQDLPFEKLVEELQPKRDLSRTPLFQVWFNMVNLGSDSLKLNGLKVEPISVIETDSKFDLSLYIGEQNNSIHLKLVYNTVLFNPGTIEWMGRHLQTLLEGIAANPEQPISTFSLLSETERYELSRRRNLIRPTNSFNEFPKQEIEQSIPARFEQQVKKYPNQVAVQTKNYRWTYQELNRQANKIAQTLLQKNPNLEEKVALVFDHDAPAIAAIFGVLKTGRTYVPIEPKYPRERVLYILEDSLAKVVLTNNKNLDRAQNLTAGKLPIINIDDINIDDKREINQEVSVDTVAYILYTSGSTGQPKGVIQNHRNVLNFIRNYTNNLHISPDDKLSLFSSYSFDAAIIDIFSALLNGATLCPFNIKEEGLADLSKWLNEQKITVYHSTPTVYRHFIQTLSTRKTIKKAQLSQVRLVVLGGEEVVKSDVTSYQEYFADQCIFVNGLGSTESSFNLQYLIDKQTQINQKRVPVGYPFDDTEILLLDRAGNPTDLFGEIAIRSSHIALGYWQKPELTKAAFLDDLQGGNKRIYRTGDLGRLNSNGTIEFLGRKDFQVKIRGFRIELGEIEAVLSQHPAVQETVVIAREDIPGDKRLVAYIIPTSKSILNQGTENEPLTPEQALIISQIQQYLKQKLPDYMVPSAFLLLDVLPLTPNGKVNRRLLPAASFAKLESGKNTTPTDNFELQITKIWENILGIKPIGLKDNFFDLGGHSLLAVRLFAEIEKIFGKNITLTTLFQYPTVGELANVLRQEGWSTSWSSLVPIQPQGSKPPFFYIHTVYGGLIHSRNLLLKMGIDQPVYGLQAKGLDGKESPHTCVEDMASHYIKEIKTVQPHGPYLLGGWCAGGMIAFEMAQQLHAQGERVELLAILEAYPPTIISELSRISERSYLDKVWFRIDRLILHLKDMIQRNRKKVISLDFQEKFIFVRESISRRIQNKIKQVVYKFYRQRNCQLPHELRHLLVTETISQAYKNYYPKPYTGKIIFFQAAEQPKEYNDYLKVWEELAAGGLEIHEVPGHHDSIISEPHVWVLAEKLRDCLERVTRS